MLRLTPEFPSRIEGYYNERNPEPISSVTVLWFKDDGTPLCSAHRKRCRKCEYVYTKDETDLARCPKCEEWRFCISVVTRPGGRCRMHGGNPVVGAAHPRFQTGRYSRYMPTRLRDRFLEASRDPELLNLRKEIALMDARISDLLSRVDVGDSGRLFGQAREAFIGFRNALDRQDSETMRVHLQTLDRLLAQGHSDFAAWEDIRVTMETRRKLVDTEITRLTKMGQIITAEDVTTLIHAVAGLAKRLIKDQTILNEFITEILALGSHRPR